MTTLDTAKYRRERAAAPTKAEAAFQKILHRLGLPHRFQAIIDNRIVDFVVLSRLLLLIEIDGSYYFTPVQNKRDRLRDRQLSRALGEVPTLFLRFVDAPVFEDSAEATLKKLFPVYVKQTRKELLGGYISPRALRSFYKFLLSVKSARACIRCIPVEGTRDARGSQPLRTALGALLERTALVSEGGVWPEVNE
jgi:very-short-patch-repair endonuclease